MSLRFSKMHGLGNDFVVIDAVRQKVALTPEQVRFIADVNCHHSLMPASACTVQA